MSIESDAQKDLVLNEDDAEGVVGGSKKSKKNVKTKPAVHHAASTSVTYNYSPGATGPAQPYTSDGDDCDDPGYAGSADTSSPST